MSAISVFKRLYNGETHIDFIGKRRIWYAISGALVLVSLMSFWTRGLNYGIEFEGGVSIQAPVGRGTVRWPGRSGHRRCRYGRTGRTRGYRRTGPGGDR